MTSTSLRPGLLALLFAGVCLGAALIPKNSLAKAPFSLEPNDRIITPSISNNGRWLAVQSRATNLVEAGSDVGEDVFLIDTKKGDVLQVSRTLAGGDPAMSCTRPSVNASGRYVAYDSADPNIVEGDTAGTTDVFLFDRKKQSTVRVSTTLGGGGASMPAIDGKVSKNGRWVAFASAASGLVDGDTNNASDVFVRDVKQGETRLVSRTSAGALADDDSEDPRISANGRYVVFSSLAALVPADDNGVRDVYRFDLKKGVLELVSANFDGVVGDADSGNGQLDISDNGRWVTFASGAQNLVGDSAAFSNVFRKDMKKGTLELVNRAEDGTPSTGIATTHALSPDGRYVAFGSLGTDLGPVDANALRDLYLKDTKKGTVTRLSVGFEPSTDVDEPSENPSLSKGAKWVAWQSLASTLIDGDVDDVQADVFVLRR